MPKVNEPQRVITRGRTRTIGEPRRPHEPSGTIKERPAAAPVAGAPRSVASRASSEKGTGRFIQEPPRDAPRTTADERRPLDRIAALEAQVAELELLIRGNGQPLEDHQSPPLAVAVSDLEAVVATLAESVGGVVEQVGTMGDEAQAPTGLCAIVADLSDRMVAVGPAVDHHDTEPPTPSESVG